MHARMLVSAAAITLLTAAALATSACSAGPQQVCRGQCVPPFQLHVAFRAGTSKQAAITAIRKCQPDPLITSIGQPQRLPETPGRWTAIIYTTKLPTETAHTPLLTCLHRSPAVMTAAWPD